LVRSIGTPVLLDFGATVAEMSRMLTAIVLHRRYEFRVGD
jgi:hypothetical protein